MIILTIKTDQQNAEIGLFDSHQKIDYVSWLAHRQLAETIHTKIADMLRSHHKGWKDIRAIACYKGPGSLTGLRIGLSVANALAYGLQIPVAAENGEQWILKSINKLKKGDNDHIAVPEYGRAAHITMQKK